MSAYRTESEGGPRMAPQEAPKPTSEQCLVAAQQACALYRNAVDRSQRARAEVNAATVAENHAEAARAAALLNLANAITEGR